MGKIVVNISTGFVTLPTTEELIRLVFPIVELIAVQYWQRKTKHVDDLNVTIQHFLFRGGGSVFPSNRRLTQLSTRMCVCETCSRQCVPQNFFNSWELPLDYRITTCNWTLSRRHHHPHGNMNQQPRLCDGMWLDMKKGLLAASSRRRIKINKGKSSTK